MIRPIGRQFALTASNTGCPCKRPALAGLSAVELPIVGAVPTWLLLAAAAAAVYFFFMRGRAAVRNAKARRIIRRVTEY